MTESDTAILHPGRLNPGDVRVPGDKSISHRAALLAALADGDSVLTGFLDSEDCLHTLDAVAALGARVTRTPGRLAVSGAAWREPGRPLDLGNSGTGLRLLAGLLAGRPWTTEMTGDASLRSRPMGRIREPLERMGARVELTGPAGCAPVRVTGGPLRGIEYALPVASAQVKSCVLLAALFAEGKTEVIEPLPTRDHTERALQALGIPVRIEGSRIGLCGFGPAGPRLPARAWEIPGDFSSAAFWLAAGAMGGGARLTVRGVGLNPRRTALLGVLTRMGAKLTVVPLPGGAPAEPRGDVTVEGAGLRGVEIGGGDIPNLIDELPMAAAAAARAEGQTAIRDARELRVKESDRIACMARNLRALGVPVTERPDGLDIRGGARLRGGVELDSYGDHRIAMAMAILALHADAPVRLRGIACIRTSYPEFWKHLEELGAHVDFDHSH